MHIKIEVQMMTQQFILGTGLRRVRTCVAKQAFRYELYIS